MIFKVAKNPSIKYLKYEYIFPPISKMMNDFYKHINGTIKLKTNKIFVFHIFLYSPVKFIDIFE
jgi:hypothetical protein